MATAIYVKEDTLREYVAHLKEMVERGEIEAGKTIFSIATLPGKYQPLPPVGPENMSNPVRGLCRMLMEHTGFISRVGNILKGTGILNNSFSDYTTEQIVELGMDAAEATKKGRQPPKGFKGTPPTPPPPEDEATIAVPVYDLINVLDDDEKEDLIHQLTASLRGSGVNVKKALAEVGQELERRVKEIDAVRAELRDTKVQLNDAREALGHAKTHVQPRVVERFVHVPNKPAGAPGTGGGSGGYQKGTIVVHRKPLMGHTPKAVRDVKEEK